MKEKRCTQEKESLFFSFFSLLMAQRNALGFNLQLPCNPISPPSLESLLSESGIEVDINKARVREERLDPAKAVWDEQGGRSRSELQLLGSIANMSFRSLASSRHIVIGMARALHAA